MHPHLFIINRPFFDRNHDLTGNVGDIKAFHRDGEIRLQLQTAKFQPMPFGLIEPKIERWLILLVHGLIVNKEAASIQIQRNGMRQVIVF